MVKHRGTLTLVGLCILAAVSLIVGLQVHAWVYRLPDPATADRDGLVRWLVLADLNEHPDEVCRTLVDRFEAVFGEEDGKQAEANVQDLDTAALSTAQVAQVESNVARLKKVWFFARVDEYATLPADQQAAFLDRQICNVFRCAEVDRRLDAHDEPGAEASTNSTDVGGYVGTFFDSLGQWRAEAPAAKQDAIQNAVKDGLIRWLATHDLAEQSPSVRRQIVAGLEKELGTKLYFGDSTSTLAPGERKMFWHNVEVLAEAWFHVKATEFAALKGEQRAKFVAQQLSVADELAAHWPANSQPPTGSGTNSTGGAAAIASRINRWVASTDESQRESAREFAGALQSAWIARKLGDFLRGG